MINKKQTRTTKSKTTKKRAAARVITLKERLFETDSTYLLKLVAVLLLGAIWLRFGTPLVWLGIPFGAFPLGLVLGLLLVKLAERHQSDRKIWYVVLIVVAIITYSADKGIVI